MKRLRSLRTGVAQGDVEVFSDFQSDGDMWAGTGPRERRCWVRFDESFSDPPMVQVSASLMDMHNAAAYRAELVAENVSAEGFEVVFRTWSDSRVARLRVAWMAIGDLPFEDDWQVD